jgi:hypothetical protein
MAKTKINKTHTINRINKIKIQIHPLKFLLHRTDKRVRIKAKEIFKIQMQSKTKIMRMEIMKLMIIFNLKFLLWCRMINKGMNNKNLAHKIIK